MNIEPKESRIGGFHTEQHKPDWYMKRTWQAYDDCFELPEQEYSRVSVGELGGIAHIVERRGNNYNILSYTFQNPRDKSEKLEIRPGSLVVLENEDSELFEAKIDYLYFYDREDGDGSWDFVEIDAAFESSQEEEDVPDWLNLQSIVEVRE